MTKKIKLLLLLAVFLLPNFAISSHPLWAEETVPDISKEEALTSPISNAKIIRLHQLGEKDTFIIARIEQAQRVSFSLDSAAIAFMKKNGVSDAVTTAMFKYMGMSEGMSETMAALTLGSNNGGGVSQDQGAISNTAIYGHETRAQQIPTGLNVSLFYGKKSLNKDNWKPLDSQNEFGIGLEFQRSKAPEALVISYLSSEDSQIEKDSGFNAEVTGKTSEISIGVRHSVGKNRTRFFIESGLAMISANIQAAVTINSNSASASESNSNLGYWIGVGGKIMVSDTLSVGILGRISKATVKLYGKKGEAGGTHFNAFATYHFGKTGN